MRRRMELLGLGWWFALAGLQGADLDSLVRERLPEMLRTYEHLHAHPELSYQERETAAFLAARLRELGFEVTEGVGRYQTGERPAHGVVGILRNGEGPTLLLRTDLDALPVEEKTGARYASRVRVRDEAGNEVGVMHACGHDVHMTVFLSTAELLTRLRDAWRGTLLMVAQPAEERGAGARALLADGLYERFPRPHYALALHVAADLEAGKIGYRPGYALANVDSVDILIRGKGGHGAYPQTTRDPIVLAAQVILALQTIVSREISPLDPAVVSVGSIHAGAKHNVIPDEARLQLTVRSYKPEVRRHILDSIRRITLGLAQAAGIPPELAPQVQFSEEEYTPSTYNDPLMTQRVVAALERELGKERVVETPPVMGGEDFGRYALEGEIPICMFWLGAVDPPRLAAARSGGEPLPSLHSSQFLPRADLTLLTGTRALTAAVLELLGAGK